MYDVLIKGGTVVDGTGAPARVADIAISDGLVVAVGPDLDGDAAEVIDATGLLVAPGFVDIHTHYDGQVTWDDQILPSSAHGVTTIVLGNCGIGFAPVRPGDHDLLISLMEGVEDIPGSALHEGIVWGWESFPEYLDFLASRRYALDLAALVPHSAVRAYVMGARAMTDEDATAAELVEMARIVQEGMEAGAVGFGSSRIGMHQASDGQPVPGTNADIAELLALGEAMAETGRGIFEVALSGVAGNATGTASTLGKRADRRPYLDEITMSSEFSKRTGRPVSFTIAETRGLGTEGFEQARALIDECVADGAHLYPQFSVRPTAILSSFEVFHAFQARPTYQALEHLPIDERMARLRDPAVKAAILAEADVPTESSAPMENLHAMIPRALGDAYALGEPPCWEPDPSLSILTQAAARGLDPMELLYDIMIDPATSGVVVIMATNYNVGDLRVTEELLREPSMIIGLGDGGAHVRAICDAANTTYLLVHWARDRTRGPKLPIELVVKKQAADTAKLVGLTDRGELVPGKRADLNVIDFERLTLLPPRLANDLPAGGQRFLQDADGYVLTMVHGVITRRDDADTGARPGRLIRSGR